MTNFESPERPINSSQPIFEKVQALIAQMRELKNENPIRAKQIAEACLALIGEEKGFLREKADSLLIIGIGKRAEGNIDEAFSMFE